MPAPEGELRWDVRASVDDRRDQILRSLASFVRDRRLASLTMRDIADRLGLVKGNLYYYFKSKQDILYHCHVKCIAISLAALDEVRARHLPPVAALRRLLVSTSATSPRTPTAAFLLTDLESLTPAQAQALRRHARPFRARRSQMIRDGIADGEFAVENVSAGFTIPDLRHQLDPEMAADGVPIVRRDRREHGRRRSGRCCRIEPRNPCDTCSKRCPCYRV